MADPVISPPEVTPTSPLEHSRRQLEALLEVGEAIAQQRDLPALFHDLARRLHSVVDFDFLTLVLHDASRNVMRLHVLETRIPSEKPTGSESPVEGNPSGWVWQTQQTFPRHRQHAGACYSPRLHQPRAAGFPNGTAQDSCARFSRQPKPHQAGNHRPT